MNWITSAHRKAVAVAGTAMAAVVAFAVPASAHTPVILTDQDRVPVLAPLAADGTDPLAFYGVVHGEDVRSAQIDLVAGNTWNEAILVPNLAPENTLTPDQLPTLLLIAPDATVTVVSPTLHIPFTDPESGRNYLVLGKHTTTATVTGTYTLMVVTHAPERFVISSGIESENFHGLLRGSVATEAQVDAWYATAPTSCAAPRNAEHVG